MSVGLKEIVWEMSLDAFEILFQQRDVEVRMRVWVQSRFREEFELRSVYLEAIDLLMMKCMGAYDSAGTEEFPARTAQAGVGGERLYSVSQELMVRAGMSRWKRWGRSLCVSVSE